MVVDALEEVVVPGEHQLVDRSLADRSDVFERRRRLRTRPAPVHVVPRPDDQPLVRPSFGRACRIDHAGEVLDAAGEEGVIPTFDVEDGHPDRRIAVTDAPLPPEVVSRRVGYPVEIPRRHSRIGGLHGRESAVGQEVQPPGRVGRGGLQRRSGGVVMPVLCRGGGQTDRPRLHERQPELPALVHPAVVVVRGGVRGHDGRQVRGSRGSGQPLGGPDVGRAVHADFAVRARQCGRPLHRVVPVVAVVSELAEGARGCSLAPNILDDNEIAVRGEPIGALVARRLDLRARLAVLGAHEDHRNRVGGVRPVDVGAEHGSVAHPGGYVGLLAHPARAAAARRRPGRVRAVPAGPGARRQHQGQRQRHRQGTRGSHVSTLRNRWVRSSLSR